MWLVDLAMMERYHFSMAELDAMDIDHYWFIAGIMEATDLEQKKELEKLKKPTR